MRIFSIGFEVSSESGVLVSLLLNHSLDIWETVFIPCDQLLVWEMDLKSDNIGALMH